MFKFQMEDKKPIFTMTSDASATSTLESPTENAFNTTENLSLGAVESAFSPVTPNFQGRAVNELNNFLVPQEPQAGDVAPASIGTSMDEEWLMNLRLHSTEMMPEEVDNNPSHYFNMGGARAESLASSGVWGEGSVASSSAARNVDVMDSFEFVIKSLSSASEYMSMLTREQASVLRGIRPSLLYELLTEVAKVRSEKRMRRALPNECAFCKNNGENEECYSSHALKDWRGRVLCPVLRAFRCPRCGASGDRAHTIKYCPENNEFGVERSGSFMSRRRAQPPSSSSMMFGGGHQPATPPVPSPSPAPGSLSQSSMWNPFN